MIHKCYCSWFCGWSQDEYIQQQLRDKDIGSFLIRFSNRRSFCALVVKVSQSREPEDMFCKYLVKFDESRKTYQILFDSGMGKTGNHPSFNALDKLVEYYYNNPIPHKDQSIRLRPTRIGYVPLDYGLGAGE